MNVLITGGAGYIGSACTEYFLNVGHAITVYDNLSEGHRSAVHPKAQFVHGDCLDRVAFIQALQSHRIEAVVHFAASALVGESMKQPGKYFHNNTIATHSILEACVATGVRKFVFSATQRARHPSVTMRSRCLRPVVPTCVMRSR